MKLALLADIHANVTAFEAVLSDISSSGKVDAIALLGDLVNYGPRPNETIGIVKALPLPVVVNLWGNHEYSLFGGNLDRFATDRGRSVLRYTRSILTKDSIRFLDESMLHEGLVSCRIDNLSFLFIHGNLDDPYWGKLSYEKMQDIRYKEYDYMISAHSHIPHYVEIFFQSDDVAHRNKKRTIFINPGSVGQPRNHNPFAQYGILDTLSGNYEHRAVRYLVEEEQRLYDDSVDSFYKERLTLGI